MQLFPDQYEVKRAAYASLRNHQSTLIQACTGFGKTALAVDFCNDAIRSGKTVTINVPRRELARQLGSTLIRYGIPHGYIASGIKPNPFASIQISMTETLARRLGGAYKTDLLITDECHVGGESLTRVVGAWKSAGRKLVGLSATPQRMDGKGMDTWFDDMVCGPSMRWLIDNGRLNRYRVFASETAEAVMAAGLDDVDQAEFDSVIFGDAARHYKEHANGYRGLAFCRTVKHAEDTAAYFNANGIPSAAIHGKLNDDEMIRRVMAFARREILVLTNCQICTFGWDLNQLTGMDATVECIFMLRAVTSLPLYMQIAGRMLRVGDRPSIMFDHASTIARHGLPCAEREWTLDGRLKNPRDGQEKLVPVRQCPIGEGGCGFVHKPSPACPNCGRVYPVRDVNLETVDTDLKEITPEEYAVVRKQERQIQGRADTFEALLDLERAKGHKAGWADRVWISRGNSKHGLRERRARWRAGLAAQ